MSKGNDDLIIVFKKCMLQNNEKKKKERIKAKANEKYSINDKEVIKTEVIKSYF